MIDIKKELLSRGMKESDFDTHETDLYVRKTPVSEKFLREEYEFPNQVTSFIDEIDHVMWYEIPFANIEAWERKHEIAMAIETGRKVG